MNVLEGWKQRSEVFAAAQQAKRRLPAWAIVLIFIGLFFFSQMISGFCSLPLLIPAIASGAVSADDAAINAYLGASGIALYMTIPTTLIFLLFMKYVEGRSLLSAGFTRRHTAVRYLTGLALGVVMIAATIGLACVLGGMHFAGFSNDLAWGTLAIFFFGFLLQGMSEEVVCRGFLMVSMANRAPLWLAVAVNSVVFAALHMLNAGMTPLALVNLALYGLFASLYFLRTDNIWGIAALHSAWNFMQGNVLGMEVSGMAVPDPVMSFKAVADSPSILSGGVFGLEGGVAMTIMLAVGIAILAYWPKRQTKQPGNPEAYSVS